MPNGESIQDRLEYLRGEITARLFQEIEPWSPAEWDTLGMFERSSDFGGELSSTAVDFGRTERGMAAYCRWLTLFGGASVVLPVRLESGPYLLLRETTPESCNGVFWTTDARVTELCGDGAEYHNPDWVRESLRSELEEWVQFFEGDVWGYTVTDSAGRVVDSLWGLYGLEYALEEMGSALDAAIVSAAERRLEVARGWGLAHGLALSREWSA